MRPFLYTLEQVRKFFSREYIKQKKVLGLHLVNANFDRQYHIIYHKNKYLTVAMQAFIALCHEYPTTGGAPA